MALNELRLRPLGPSDEQEFLAAHRAMGAEGFLFGLDYCEDMAWPDYLRKLDTLRRGLDVAADRVPSTLLVADVAGQIVGRASIRHELNEFLAREGGHIGYGVLAQHRRRGWATAILEQSIVIARSYGIDPILVTCDVDNIGSAMVIERCGGVFESVIETDSVPKRRYWIS